MTACFDRMGQKTRSQVSLRRSTFELLNPRTACCVISPFFTSCLQPHGKLRTMPCMYSSSTSCFKSHTLSIVWYEGDLRWDLWSSLLHASTWTSHLPVSSLPSALHTCKMQLVLRKETFGHHTRNLKCI